MQSLSNLLSAAVIARAEPLAVQVASAAAEPSPVTVSHDTAATAARHTRPTTEIRVFMPFLPLTQRTRILTYDPVGAKAAGFPLGPAGVQGATKHPAEYSGGPEHGQADLGRTTRRRRGVDLADPPRRGPRDAD